MAARIEASILSFSVCFETAGLGPAPEGLLWLLERFTMKPNESSEQMRLRIYRRLWGIIWFGSKIGRGMFQGAQPTYVYPQELKGVVRGIIPEELRDYDDPTGAKVYNVTLRDLSQTRWPAGRQGRQ